MTLPDYINLIVQWSTDRKIIPNSTPDAQWLKGLSELGELADAIAKGNREEVMDSLGDVFTCLVNVCALQGILPSLHQAVHAPSTYLAPAAELNLVAMLANTWAEMFYDHSQPDLKHTACLLCSLAERHNTTLLDCVAVAYEQIKDRRGTLLPNGVFVKEE